MANVTIDASTSSTYAKSFRFVLYAAAGPLFTELKSSTDVIDTSAGFQQIHWISFGVIFLNLVVIGVIVLKPLFAHIHQEKINAMRTFLAIPPQVVKLLSTRKVQVDMESDSDGDEVCEESGPGTNEVLTSLMDKHAPLHEASSKAVATLPQQPLKAELIKTSVILFTVLAFWVVAFAENFDAVTKIQFHNDILIHATLHRSLLKQVVVNASQIVSGDADLKAEALPRLAVRAGQLRENQDWMRSHISPDAADQINLMFGFPVCLPHESATLCPSPNGGYFGRGLDGIVNQLHEEIIEFIHDVELGVNVTSLPSELKYKDLFLWNESVQKHVDDIILESITLYDHEMTVILDEVARDDHAFFAAAMGSTFASFFVFFRRNLNKDASDIHRMRKMLSIIPLDVVARILPIREFVESEYNTMTGQGES
eukprot:GFYU01007232.1.p1 GENE.GFYU01007232.1~~GFYU01007232.1.p1  ORF type:complete len:473 (-),score=118.09 GFYU01007232.1:235-1512(-)